MSFELLPVKTAHKVFLYTELVLMLSEVHVCVLVL